MASAPKCLMKLARLPLSDLWVTQASLRHPETLAELSAHLKGGGYWVDDPDPDGQRIQVVVFEDGRYFLRDGHHRCVAMALACSLADDGQGRDHLLPEEYHLERWQYSQWTRPNFGTTVLRSSPPPLVPPPPSPPFSSLYFLTHSV